MANLSIRPIPLLIGPMQTFKFTYMLNFQDLTSIAGYIWYIEGAEKKILIDAGITADGGVKMGGPKRVAPQTMEQGLAKLGLKPEDIEIIIITHMHKDHMELAHKFKNATFIIQKSELDFAMNPHPIEECSYFREVLLRWIEDRDRRRGEADRAGGDGDSDPRPLYRNPVRGRRYGKGQGDRHRFLLQRHEPLPPAGGGKEDARDHADDPSRRL